MILFHDRLSCAFAIFIFLHVVEHNSIVYDDIFIPVVFLPVEHNSIANDAFTFIPLSLFSYLLLWYLLSTTP
jgi:hypothetical protein